MESALFTWFLHKKPKAVTVLNQTNPSLGPKVNLKSLSASYSQYLQTILRHGQSRGFVSSLAAWKVGSSLQSTWYKNTH